MEEYLAELDEAMFDFDAEKMKFIIEKMEHYGYKGCPMKKIANTAIRKVEMSDFMSAYEVIAAWKEQTEKGGAGN